LRDLRANVHDAFEQLETELAVDADRDAIVAALTQLISSRVGAGPERRPDRATDVVDAFAWAYVLVSRMKRDEAPLTRLDR
jgi:hypothetical protein